MKKSEIKFIQEKIEYYNRWAREEEAAAKRAYADGDPDEHDLYLMQARLHSCAAGTLYLLLDELQALAG